MNTTLSLSKEIAFTALFATLCCIGTLLISIPIPGGHGYFNVGDVFVLLSAWFLGGLYGPIASAVGSALADLFGGYAIYAPATFIIKGADAFVAYLVCLFFKKLIKKESLDFIPRALSAIAGEAVMVAGYFFYESLLYGFAGAVLSIVGNLLQGACCLTLATALFACLYPIKPLRKFFPSLIKD